MFGSLTVEPLARHRGLMPLVAEWFVTEWPAWYGQGGPGNLRQDIEAFAASEVQLPVGFVAFDNGVAIGAGALKVESVPALTHLTPWAAAGFVIPKRRGQGIGQGLLRAMSAHACSLGFQHTYCGTSTAGSLLLRSGWSVVEVVQHAGKPLTIYRSPTIGSS